MASLASLACGRRWFPEGKVVFVAPTRPLVEQQLAACTQMMAIPKAHTVLLTSDLAKGAASKAGEARISAWAAKRMFFCTPQILENDLLNGILPEKK